MEVKKYNPFVVMNKSKSKPKTKPTGFTRERSSKTKPKIKPKPQTKLEARGLSLENKKKLDTIYAKGFVKTSRKQ